MLCTTLRESTRRLFIDNNSHVPDTSPKIPGNNVARRVIHGSIARRNFSPLREKKTIRSGTRR
jgi:hypothetical protein